MYVNLKEWTHDDNVKQTTSPLSHFDVALSSIRCHFCYDQPKNGIFDLETFHCRRAKWNDKQRENVTVDTNNKIDQPYNRHTFQDAFLLTKTTTITTITMIIITLTTITKRTITMSMTTIKQQ